MHPVEARAKQFGTVFGTWQVREVLVHANQVSGALLRLVRDLGNGPEQCYMYAIPLVQKQGRWASMPQAERQAAGTDAQPRIQNALQGLIQERRLPDGNSVPEYLEHSLRFWADMDCFGWDLLVRVRPQAAGGVSIPPVVPVPQAAAEVPQPAAPAVRKKNRIVDLLAGLVGLRPDGPYFCRLPAAWRQ